MSVIGFDIGNETCVIASAKRGGIDVLLNDEAKRETPSVVSFGDKQRFLGSAGAAFATSNPKSTITQIKRLIGRLYNEPSVQEDLKLLPFVTSEGPRGGIMIELDYMNEKWTFTPVEILGMLFTHLKQLAEKNLESNVVDCVIGIPSYFTDLQRREYLDAARIAGLRPLRLIPDGTAIALGYGICKTDLSKSEPINVLFVDIGHCDTQVTVAAFEQEGMKILSHSFDLNLGGRDFDEVLFRHFAAEIKERYNINVYSNTHTSITLRASCEKLKRVLSNNAEAALSIERLMDGKYVRGFITRGEFENLSSELLERVTVPCVKALKDSGLSVDKIYAIELVGSGSRIPAIMWKLTSLFKKEPTSTLNASECVARGCALRCAMLSPAVQIRNYQVEDIFPYSIALSLEGLKDKSLQEFILFPRGSPIPSYKMITHTGIGKFNFQISYVNKMDFPAGVSPIVGRFVIGLSEDSAAEMLKVEFKLKLNNHGIVEIESATVLEYTHPARTLQSYLGTYLGASRTSNIDFSENLDVATTEDELRAAQEREQMLAEQDKKVEQTKADETRTSLARMKNVGVSETVFDERRKNEIHESQEIKQMLVEKEIKVEQSAEKRHSCSKLLDSADYKNMDGNARAQATKHLLSCLEEYRLIAGSLPPSQKEEVDNECNRVEQWLNDLSQQHSCKKNIDPARLPSIIKDATEYFVRRCKRIMLS